MKKIIFVSFLLFLILTTGFKSGYAAPADSVPISTISGQNKISLDIKGMDIVDVFNLMATRVKMNIVVGKNVTGKVTLFLKDVNIWDAFELIILSNDLAYEKKDGIINVMTQRDYELQYGERYKDKKEAKSIKLKYAKSADLSRTLTQMKTNIGRIVSDEGSNTVVLIDTPAKIKEMEDFIKNADTPVQSRVFGLNYAQADKIGAKIQESVTKGIGSMRIDERTNKVVVTDYVSKLDEIAKLISAFDEKTPQVLIDAQIIEIKPSDKFEMGVDWDFWIKSQFKMSNALPIGTAGRLLVGTANVTPTKSGEFKAIIDLLRTIGDTKILSSPRIMVLNNQEAKILVGTKDAYITSSVSQSTDTAVTSQTVNFVDVGIKLYVTPTINRDGFVTMKIRPEISSATRTDITSEGKITQIPIVTTSETETTVMVKDGVTIIIGGLRKDEKYKTVKKIPILGDIPLLGLAFRNKSDEVKKTELVILLTPHIMTGEDAYTDFYSVKPEDGAVAKMVDGEIVVEKTSGYQTDKPALQRFEEAPQGFDGMDSYKKFVWSKINRLAANNMNQSKVSAGRAQFSFVLGYDGALIGEPTEIFSNNGALSEEAAKSIKEAAPFPPFPKYVEKEKEVFRINFSCE